MMGTVPTIQGERSAHLEARRLVLNAMASRPANTAGFMCMDVREFLETVLSQARDGNAAQRSVLRVRLRRMPSVIDSLRAIYGLPSDAGTNEVIRRFLEPE